MSISTRLWLLKKMPILTLGPIFFKIKRYDKGANISGKDDINPKMFKYLGEGAIKYIQETANQCLWEVKWVWSKAKVIFLRKVGKDTYAKPGSYRPISISSYIGKLMEK